MRDFHICCHDRCRRDCCLVSLGLSLVLACLATAQRISLEASRQPYYVGEPIQLRLSVEGFDEQSEPVCDLGTLPDGLTAELLGVAPQVSQSITIINGRTTRSRRVLYVFDYRLTASRPGKFALVRFVSPKAIRRWSGKQ